MEKNTIVINLLGGPGVGKSTTMAAIFSKLKNMNIDCELVTEFAKDLVWEKRDETFKDEIYIFAKQAHRMFRVNGKTDVIITDRPLILTCFYGKTNKELSELCLSEFNKYNNYNFFLKRKKEYNPNGRNQSEEEAIQIDKEIKLDLFNLGIGYDEIDGDEFAADDIVDIVLDSIGKSKNNKDIVEFKLNSKYQALYDEILELGYESEEEDEDLDGNWTYWNEFHKLKDDEYEINKFSTTYLLKEALTKAQKYDELMKKRQTSD